MTQNTNWDDIRQLYLETDLTAAAVARRFRVSAREVTRHIREEGWDAQRQDFRCRQTAKAMLCLGAVREQRIARVDGVAEQLLSCLEQAARELSTATMTVKEKSKIENGERIRDFQQLLPEEPALVDRGGLKQLTAVLKDIKDILMLRSDLDDEEQKARIAKLSRDQQKEEAPAVTVILEGQANDYAG